jgi:hypothetical protein
MAKSKIKNQNFGIAASRDDFTNFAFYILIFAFLSSFHSIRPLSRGLTNKKTAVLTREPAVFFIDYQTL